MIAEMAQGVAVEGVRCFTASALPKPLFCMPTSMAMVRRIRSHLISGVRGRLALALAASCRSVVTGV